MIHALKAKLAQFATSEHGASAIEYGMIAGLIGAIIIIAVTGIGGGLGQTFTTICTALGGTTCS